MGRVRLNSSLSGLIFGGALVVLALGMKGLALPTVYRLQASVVFHFAAFLLLPTLFSEPVRPDIVKGVRLSLIMGGAASLLFFGFGLNFSADRAFGSLVLGFLVSILTAVGSSMMAVGELQDLMGERAVLLGSALKGYALCALALIITLMIMLMIAA